MTTNKLTDKAIRAAQPGTKLSDGGGLYLVVPPKNNRWWRFDFRFEEKQQSISFGVYGTEGGTTLAMARDKANDARKLLREGKRPSGTRGPTEQTAPGGAGGPRPFDVVADEWLETRKHGAGAETIARDTRMVGYLKNGKGAAKGFGSMPFNEIDNIVPLLKACNYPTRVRLISTARNLVAYAKVHRDFPKDKPSPFEGINWSLGFAQHKTEHRAAITNEEEFGALLRMIHASEGLTGIALQLLALTFVRPGTAASAKWADIDLDRARWVIPFSQLKMAWKREAAGQAREDFVVPLSRQAVVLLRELHEMTGDQVFLFPGRAGRPMTRNALIYALHGLGYKGMHSPHGFRSTASTMLNRERDQNGRRRFERSLIEMQLDHQDASVRAIYDRDDMMAERIELMQVWADMVDTMRSSGNVVPMRRPA